MKPSCFYFPQVTCISLFYVSFQKSSIHIQVYVCTHICTCTYTCICFFFYINAAYPLFFASGLSFVSLLLISKSSWNTNKRYLLLGVSFFCCLICTSTWFMVVSFFPCWNFKFWFNQIISLSSEGFCSLCPRL